MTDHEIEKLIELHESDRNLASVMFASMVDRVYNFLNKRREKALPIGGEFTIAWKHSATVCNKLECITKSFSDLITKENKNNFKYENNRYVPTGKSVIRCHNCNKPIKCKVKTTGVKLHAAYTTVNNTKWLKDKKFITELHALYTDLKNRQSFNMQNRFRISVELTATIINQNGI